MPYITQQDRDKYDDAINEIARALLLSVPKDQIGGHVNYIISSIIWKILGGLGERYFWFEKFIGTLECAKLELYRRLVGPYENEAINKNGDIEWKNE